MSVPAFIQPVVDADAAQQSLQHRRFDRLRRGLAWPGRYLLGRAPRRLMRHMEILWLPYYHVTFLTRTQKGRQSTANLLINGQDRQSTFWDLSQLQWISRPDQQRFEPRLSETEALDIARQAMFQAGIQNCSWTRGPNDWAADSIQLIHYPYWVAYFEYRNRRLDIALLDAVTGQLTGPAGKVTLLAALSQKTEMGVR